MKTEEIYKLVMNLVGNVHPVADAARDGDIKDNMQVLCDLTLALHSVIDGVAYSEKDSPYASVKEVVKVANNYIDSMGITND